jgi:EF-hand domain pair
MPIDADGPRELLPAAREVHPPHLSRESNMSKLMSCLLALSFMTFGAASLVAAKPDAKPKKSAEERFAKADKNGDEKLSLEEFLGKRTGDQKEKATKRFAKLDKDSNESLSLEEFKAAQKKKK